MACSQTRCRGMGLTVRLLIAQIVIALNFNVPTFVLSFTAFPEFVRHRSTPIGTIPSTRFMSSSAETLTVPSWSELQKAVDETPVGMALNAELQLRWKGKGSAHVQNTLRLFDSNDDPQITLYRDHAGW